MRIGIDFDRVLFDTDSFDSYYKRKSGLKHVEEDVYDRNGNYDPFKHAEICDVDVKNVFKALEDLRKFLFDDVSALKEISHHDLIIVTRGNEKFQTSKVKGSNADELVDDVIVVQEGSKDQAKIDVLIDDREEELERANVECIHINRPERGLKTAVKEVKELEAQESV